MLTRGTQCVALEKTLFIQGNVHGMYKVIVLVYRNHCLDPVFLEACLVIALVHPV